MSRRSEKQPDKSGVSAEVDFLFETSWEVCNKIGGIYAVLSTKARLLKEQFGDRLIFIGPDVWTKENPSPYFKEKKTLMKQIASRLVLPWGIKIRLGRWDIPGAPIVILVDPGETASHLESIYSEMWKKYNVDSLHAYGDYEEACAFSVAAAIVIKAVATYFKKTAHTVAHFDEWTTGMGLLYLQCRLPHAATVFTTHATSIGRSICGNGKPLYDYFYGYNGDQMAEELNMQSKHSLEKAAAHAADCFTTVSEVTARECEQLLGKRPQVVTPNGFEQSFVPNTNKYNRLRRYGRERLFDVLEGLTGKKYPEDTYIIATSGRHEYRNKGIDLFLDAMVKTEEQLAPGVEAVAFILVPGWVKGPSEALRKKLLHKKEEGVAPGYLTHELHNRESDEICQRIETLEREGKFKRLKVIYVPSYLDGCDGIVNIPYYDLIPALDLTVFPSYYEPWGYTPLESVAFGVPTVTDDKAGFGRWVLDNFTNGFEHCGVEVVARTDSNYSEARDIISSTVANYGNGDTIVRKAARNKAFMTATRADWNFFMQYYYDAFRIAINRKILRLRKIKLKDLIENQHKY